MTSGLGHPEGLFSLADSDKCVGSFLSRSDVKDIFEVDDDDLSGLVFVDIGGVDAIDEIKLRKAWYEGEIRNAPPQKPVSMDELILKAIIKKTLVGCSVESQVRIGRYQLDFKITHNRQSVFVEFDGPPHFMISRYGPPKHHPFRKKQAIEDRTGIEVVNWAYWIQRCKTNVRALFDQTVKGYGAIWGASVHFGDFYFDDSAEIIAKINSRFNCMRSNGFGYFYDGNSEGRINPEHPIINLIANGKERHERLLPKGHADRNVWLPRRLQNAGNT